MKKLAITLMTLGAVVGLLAILFPTTPFAVAFAAECLLASGTIIIGIIEDKP